MYHFVSFCFFKREPKVLWGTSIRSCHSTFFFFFFRREGGSGLLSFNYFNILYFHNIWEQCIINMKLYNKIYTLYFKEEIVKPIGPSLNFCNLFYRLGVALVFYWQLLSRWSMVFSKIFESTLHFSSYRYYQKSTFTYHEV